MPKANWTNGATGSIAGASTGASIGSVIPGVGTAIGAGVGGLVGGLTGLFGGGRKKKKKISTFDKRQQQLNEAQHQSILGEGPLADLYNYNPEQANEVFDKTFANPAYRDLNERAIPSVTGQFRKAGLENSSYVADAVSRLARDVQEGLDAQRGQYLQGQQQQSQTAKRNAVENLQNRQTFAVDTAGQSGYQGFDIDKILKSISPEQIDQVKEYFNGRDNNLKTSAGTTSVAPV
jgi:hypothetical protein